MRLMVVMLRLISSATALLFGSRGDLGVHLVDGAHFVGNHAQALCGFLDALQPERAHSCASFIACTALRTPLCSCSIMA